MSNTRQPDLFRSVITRLDRWPATWVYLLIALPISLVGLGATGVVTMEGIVADSARTMARTQEYAVPYLYGEIYTYKPPLAYWLTLASFQIFGQETEWTLRLPFVLSGVLMGWGVLILSHRVAGRRAGLLCGIATLTSAIALQKLRLAEFDMLLTAGVGIAIAVACLRLAGEGRSGLWLLGYLALGLAFLAKGAPALMFYGPGLLAAAWLTGQWRQLFSIAHLCGVLLFLAIAGGWLLSAYLAAGWEAFAQPMEEAQDKGLTWNLDLILSTLSKPLLTWALFLPWTWLLPTSFRAGSWRSEPARRIALGAAAFVGAGVAVFMTVPADESRYLLPLAGPMGLLCGLTASHFAGVSHRRRLAIVVFAIIIGLGAVGAGMASISSNQSDRWWLILGAGFLLIWTAVRAWRAGARSPVRLLGAVAMVVWLAQVAIVEPHRASSRSLQATASQFEVSIGPDKDSRLWTAPLSKDFKHSSLFFYLRRPVSTMSDVLGWPSVGDHVVLFSDEHQQLMGGFPFDFEIVERSQQRKTEILLLRVSE